jgi:cell division protein FtsX
LRGIGIWIVPVVGLLGSLLSGILYLVGLALVGQEAFFSIDNLTTLAWRSLYDGVLTLPVLLVVLAVLGVSDRRLPLGSKPL